MTEPHHPEASTYAMPQQGTTTQGNEPPQGIPSPAYLHQEHPQVSDAHKAHLPQQVTPTHEHPPQENIDPREIPLATSNITSNPPPSALTPNQDIVPMSEPSTAGQAPHTQIAGQTSLGESQNTSPHKWAHPYQDESPDLSAYALQPYPHGGELPRQVMPPVGLPHIDQGQPAQVTSPVEDELNSEIFLKAKAAPKRSAKTEAAYAERVRQLYRWSERKRTSKTDPTDVVNISPLDIVRDFIASADSRGKSAFYLYRSALLWFLHPRINKAPEYAQAYQEMAATKASPEMISKIKRRTVRKTSKKTIPDDDFRKLLNILSANAVLTRSRSGCNWSAVTQYWMHAGLASGLRPNEWEHAYWQDESHAVLMAPNSKIKLAAPAYARAQNGKTVYDEDPAQEISAESGSNSDDADLHHEIVNQSLSLDAAQADAPSQFRAIPIEPEDRLWVDMHMTSIAQAQKDWGMDFQYYYDRCRKTLYRACNKAFNGKKNYSLYTLRGQFSADMKNIMPLHEVGKLMGHTDESYRTTQGNYGHQQFGRKKFRREASSHADDVANQDTPIQQAPMNDADLAGDS